MITATRKNNGLLPSLVTDFFERGRLLPDLADLENSLFDRWDIEARIPSANIVENSRDYKIELAAPGLEKTDFKIEVADGYLTISAEKKEEKKEEKENYRRREFSYNAFSRSFQLPDNTIPDQINAKYENGILTLSVPKKEGATPQNKKEIKIA